MAVDWSAAPGSNAVGPDETPAVAAGSNAAVPDETPAAAAGSNAAGLNVAPALAAALRDAAAPGGSRCRDYSYCPDCGCYCRCSAHSASRFSEVA